MIVILLKTFCAYHLCWETTFMSNVIASKRIGKKGKVALMLFWYDKKSNAESLYLERASVASQSGYASSNNPSFAGTF